MGQVFLATVRSKQGPPVTVAVKTRQEVSAEAEERMLVEARLLHIAAHPRIVQLLHVVSHTLPCMICLESVGSKKSKRKNR
jgi:hypothetical protein